MAERAAELGDVVRPRGDHHRQRGRDDRERHRAEQVRELVADAVEADGAVGAERGEHHDVDAEVDGVERGAERERRGLLASRATTAAALTWMRSPHRAVR